MQQKSGKISRAFTNQYQARAQLGAQWPTIHAWLARTGAIHAKSTNVGRGHLTDLIKNWSVGWDG